MKQAMRDYFCRLMASYILTGREYPSTVKSRENEAKNDLLIVSKVESSKDWYYWQPIEKQIVTDFSILEGKYKTKIHQDVKDYYNSFWFYGIHGWFQSAIDWNDWYIMLQLEKVLPGKEIIELDKHIIRYYNIHKIESIPMIPIGFNSNTSLFLLVYNETGEVCIDDVEYSGKFIKIADSLVDLINWLEP